MKKIEKYETPALEMPDFGKFVAGSSSDGREDTETNTPIVP